MAEFDKKNSSTDCITIVRYGYFLFKESSPCTFYMRFHLDFSSYTTRFCFLKLGLLLAIMT